MTVVASSVALVSLSFGDVLDHVLANLHGRQVLHEVAVHSELAGRGFCGSFG